MTLNDKLSRKNIWIGPDAHYNASVNENPQTEKNIIRKILV